MDDLTLQKKSNLADRVICVLKGLIRLSAEIKTIILIIVFFCPGVKY